VSAVRRRRRHEPDPQEDRSHFPPVACPVRSAREDDLELLRQFGRPAFAYSGAQPQLLKVVEQARIVDLYIAAEAAGTTATTAASPPTTSTRAAAARGPVWILLVAR
jgi:hypothetical protein